MNRQSKLRYQGEQEESQCGFSLALLVHVRDLSKYSNLLPHFKKLHFTLISGFKWPFAMCG